MGLDLELPRRRIGRYWLGAVADRPLLHRDQHFAGLAAGILPHDAVLGHVVDQPGPTAVADAERPLQERHAAAALANDHLHGSLIEVVAILAGGGRLGRIARRGRLEVDELRRILRLGRADRRHHTVDLVVAHKRALAAENLTRARREEEHVAVAEQPLRPHFVEHHAAIRTARHLEGDAGRQVALDEAGDHVDRRLLGGENQMDAHRPALLGQPDDVLLDFLAGGHHHVGDLVGDHHDEGHGGGDRSSLFLCLGLDSLEKLLAAKGVVLREVPHAHLGEQGIPLLHLLDGPGEDRLGFLHVGDHRVHQVGQRLVRRELDHLGIDHQHQHLVRPPRHQHRHDDRIQADRLAGTGPAGDEKVGQGGHVNHHRIAGDVLPEVDRDLHAAALGLGLLDHFAEADHLPSRVGHLDADGILAGDRCDDTDARHAERDGEIVAEVRDLGEPQAGLQFDLVLRDHRARLDLDNLHLEAEFGKRLLEHAGPLANLLLLLLHLQVFGGEEQVERGQLVVGGRIGSQIEHLRLGPPLGQRLDRHRRLLVNRLLEIIVGVFVAEAGIDLGLGVLGNVSNDRNLPPLDADRRLGVVIVDVVIDGVFIIGSVREVVDPVA